jgi:hypothetical protein
MKPHSTKTFTLTDGSEIGRKIGDAIFKLNGHQGASPVIFGKKGDSALLGTISLEALGFLLDPLRRELRRLPMVLGLQSRPVRISESQPGPSRRNIFFKGKRYNSYLEQISDSLNRDDFSVGGLVIVGVEPEVYLQMSFRVALVFSVHDIPVRALEIILITDPMRFEAGDL